MDSLAGLMSMDFDFPLQAAPQFSLVQILVILSEMYTGEEDPNDDLITGLRKRWWRKRSRAQSGGRIGAGMEISWEPTFEVINVETLDYAPKTLAGVDFDDLTSIQLFYIAAQAITSVTITLEHESKAQELLARRRDAARSHARPTQGRLPTPSGGSFARVETAAQADTVDRRPLPSPRHALDASPFPAASTSLLLPLPSLPNTLARPTNPAQSGSAPMNEDPQSVVSNAYRSARGSATESREWSEYERAHSASMERETSRGAKRSRQDSEESHSRYDRSVRSRRRVQIGSRDETVLLNGDRVADGIDDPLSPRSTSTARIPPELGERLHTLYVNNYPADYSLQDLANLLTLPGHSPPLALNSKFTRSRQTANFPTKYAFVAFSKASDKRAVLEMDGYNVEHSAHYSLQVKEPISGLSGTSWHWTSFSQRLHDEYEAEQLQLTRRRKSRDTRRPPVPVHPAVGLLVPHKLMLEFPQIHLNQLPPNQNIITATILFDFLAKRVDPASILAVQVGNLDRHGSRATYVAMKTSEDSRLLNE